MARGEKTSSILDEIAQEAGAPPPPKIEHGDGYVVIDGKRYYEEKSVAAAPPTRYKKLWQNPRRPNEAPQEVEVEQVAINVAPYADRIVLDGVIYIAGRIYELPVAVAQTVRDICSRTWQHEVSTGGAYSNGVAPVRGSQSQVGVMAPGIRFG